jgi:hypothetical protein
MSRNANPDVRGPRRRIARRKRFFRRLVDRIDPVARGVFFSLSVHRAVRSFGTAPLLRMLRRDCPFAPRRHRATRPGDACLSNTAKTSSLENSENREELLSVEHAALRLRRIFRFGRVQIRFAEDGRPRIGLWIWRRSPRDFRAEAQLLQTQRPELSGGSQPLRPLKIAHGLAGGRVPLPAWRSGVEAFASQRLLYFDDAVRRRRRLAACSRSRLPRGSFRCP